MAPIKHSVLVIEDNDINREILYEILKDGYNVYSAENGRIGMELLRQYQNEIDVVLLDIQMPVMNGYEVLEEVRNDALLQHIPIIVTTGNEDVEEEKRCLQLQATEFVRKPFDPVIVLLRIESLIRMRDFALTLSDVEIDKQTGAYTRNAFMHYAAEMIEQNPGTDFTLSMTDIRGFKRLHDQYGDEIFDILRKEVQLMNESFQGQIIIGSYNVDQMIFLHTTILQNMTNEEKEQWYEDQMTRLSKEFHVTFNAGICEHIDTSIDFAQHVNNVHAALSEAKKIYNRHSHFVSKELLAKLQRNAKIETLMEEALKRGEMKVYYQPKHDAKTQRLVGAEALIRWISGEYGFISPAEFIPILEQNGFVTEVDTFVWNETCKNQRRWIDAGIDVVPISVNASRRDFEAQNIFDLAIQSVRDYHINPELMHIEVTEGGFADLSADAISRMQFIHDNGISIELDDFGTGYSSLHSLAQLPIDIVKFDISFVRKLHDPREQLVMQGCVDLIKRLQLSSVAEGVEDAATRQMIADMGIDAIQGYYYSKPLPADQFEQYLCACAKCS